MPILKHNFQMIKKVKASASGYSEVVKADVNDKLVQSIEARRKALLDEAEGACQKDLKQVWADKEFHETTIAHIESVFALVNKACKCTNDSEMILTALQSISQLKMLQGKDWDFDGFTDVVLSTPTFAEGEKVLVDIIGAIDCSLTPSSDIKVSHQSERIRLNTSYTYNVNVVIPSTENIVDERSGKPIHLQQNSSATSPTLTAVVRYGHCNKILNNAHVTVNKRTPVRTNWGYEVERVPLNELKYSVTIRLICGGRYSVTLRYGVSVMQHTFSVLGRPQNDQRVQNGPDWDPDSEDLTADPHSGNGIRYVYGIAKEDLVTVRKDSRTICQYKWGRGGKYVPVYTFNHPCNRALSLSCSVTNCCKFTTNWKRLQNV